MIICIEGPDGAGKTMLAKQLSEQNRYPIIKRTKPANEEEKAAMMADYKRIVCSGKNVIFDRCWYSELVYGPIMRDDACMTYPQMYDLERSMAMRGGLIIHCTGPRQTLWQRCQRRGEDYITDKGTFTAIYWAYEELMNMPHLIPVMRYVYQGV